MTRQTFYRWLKRTQRPHRTQRRWFLDSEGRIRGFTHLGGDALLAGATIRVCPLGALPGATEFLPLDPKDVGNAMSSKDMVAIYTASDNEDTADTRVRAALLRNLGLTEATT